MEFEKLKQNIINEIFLLEKKRFEILELQEALNTQKKLLEKA